MFRKDGGIVSTRQTRTEAWNGRPGRPVGITHGALQLCHQWLGDISGQPHQCAGTLVLAQREVLRYHKTGKSAMTLEGIAAVVGKMVPASYRVEGNAYPAVVRLERAGGLWTPRPFSEIPRQELLDAAHPSLADPEIAHHRLAPPRPGEFD